MRRTLLGIAIVWAALWSVSPAHAQPGPMGATGTSGQQMDSRAKMALEKERRAIESQARQTVSTLFRRLCPGRCELVDLTAQMEEPERVGSVEPGFGAEGSGAYDIEPKSVDMTVVLDSKLPGNFRQNIPRMIEYQLHELAPTINVRPESLDFPEPQRRPSPPEPDPEPKAKPEPKPKPPEKPEKPEEPEPDKEEKDKKEKAEKTEEKPPTFWDHLALFLKELAPWIGPILMMIVLFLLAMPLLKRLGEMTERDRAAGAAGDGAGSSGPGVDVEQLRAELTRSRSVKNRVLRRWIKEDEEAVANLVRLLGPQILKDLKADESLKPKLEAVSEEVARRRDPLSDDEIEEVANEAHARINSARVVHDEQELASDWEFLEGINVAGLKRIMRSCDTREKLHVIGQLPPSLRGSYLESLEADERRDVFMATGSGQMSKQESISLASRLRKSAEEYAHLGGEAEGQAEMVLEMLESLELAEQKSALRELHQGRPQVAEAVLSRICLESAAIQLPGDVLADAIHRTPVDTLASFLRGTEPAVRERVMEVAPSRKRDSLETELSLDVPVGKTEFLESRQAFMQTVRESARRDGVDLAKANSQVLGRNGNVSS